MGETEITGKYTLTECIIPTKSPLILNMGEPVLIDELAKKMIRLSGLKVIDEVNPNGDIAIKYIGLRPGEKLYEELLIGDNISKTSNPLIMRAEENMLETDELKAILVEIGKLSKLSRPPKK